MIVHLIVGLIKKVQCNSNLCLKKRFSSYKNESQYFPKPYEAFSGGIKVKVDLSNYAAKADTENISHVDTSSFALKTNLAILKNKVDKLDIDILVPVPTDLSKLSNIVKMMLLKKGCIWQISC